MGGVFFVEMAEVFEVVRGFDEIAVLDGPTFGRGLDLLGPIKFNLGPS